MTTEDTRAIIDQRLIPCFTPGVRRMGERSLHIVHSIEEAEEMLTSLPDVTDITFKALPQGGYRLEIFQDGHINENLYI